VYRVGIFEFNPECLKECPLVHQGVCAAIAKIALRASTDAAFEALPTHERISWAVRDAFKPDGEYEYANECDGLNAAGECGRKKLPRAAEL